MQLIPIPFDDLDKTAFHWFPFLPAISKRSKETVVNLLGQIKRHEVRIALVWDGQQARALIGVRIIRRGDDLIGELCWTTGQGMREWQHLLDVLEQLLKDAGCVEIRPICRLGWTRFLKSRGYKTTHMMMEKVL